MYPTFCASWLRGNMASESHSILSRYDLACAFSGLKPNVVRSPVHTASSGCMSLISLIARSSSVGTKCGPPQWRSEMWAIRNAPFAPGMRRSLRFAVERPVRPVSDEREHVLHVRIDALPRRHDLPAALDSD